ncbi:MAG: ABC transporter permease [Bacteroidetes bacterium]|nr:ABC transporter permease [Bacteroidota bacterium]
MKRFAGFVRKEFYHIFRDVRTMIILFGMPVAQILLFGYVITNEIKDVRIAIYDRSKDHITIELTNKMLSSGYFLLEKNVNSMKGIEQSFREGKIKEVVIFGSKFAYYLEKEGKADVQILTDATDPNTANILANYTSAVILDYLAGKATELKKSVKINPEVRMMYNPELKGVYMFIPGIMAMLLMLISAMMTSISITREKEMGTMEVLLVSPLRPIQIIIGKVIPYILLSFINALIIIALGNTVFDVPVQGSTVLLLAEGLLFIIMALSLGILISTAAKNQQVAMMISMMALMLPTILLSGFIFPVENMPDILQWLSYIVPPRWFITIIKSIMLKGVGIAYVWKETLVIAGMTLFFIALSIKKFKIRLE